MQRFNENRERVFQEIKEFINNHGFAPTAREIANNLKIPSTSTVHRQIVNLEKEGRLIRNTSKPRARAISIPTINKEDNNNQKLADCIEKWEGILNTKRMGLGTFKNKGKSNSVVPDSNLENEIALIQNVLYDLHLINS